MVIENTTKPNVPHLIVCVLLGLVESLVVAYHYRSNESAEQLRRICLFLGSGIGVGVAVAILIECKHFLKWFAIPIAVAVVFIQFMILYFMDCFSFTLRR